MKIGSKMRKGMAAEQLVVLILVIAAFSLVALFLKYFFLEAEPKEAELLCHNSVVFRAATVFNAGGGDDKNIQLIPLLCKTTDLKIEGDREEIKARMAYLMSRCWWMFNEARQDSTLDDVGKIEKALGFQDTSNQCFICHTVIIDQKQITGGDIEVEEMMSYLLKKDHTLIKDLKYIDYFQEYGGPGTTAIMDVLKPGTAYAIAFFARNTDEASFTVADAVATVAAVGGAVSCIATAGITCAIIALGGTAYLVAHGVNALQAKEVFYGKKRYTSMVVVDNLKDLNLVGNCIKKDIAE